MNRVGRFFSKYHETIILILVFTVIVLYERLGTMPVDVMERVKELEAKLEALEEKLEVRPAEVLAEVQRLRAEIAELKKK